MRESRRASGPRSARLGVPVRPTKAPRACVPACETRGQHPARPGSSGSEGQVLLRHLLRRRNLVVQLGTHPVILCTVGMSGDQSGVGRHSVKPQPAVESYPGAGGVDVHSRGSYGTQGRVNPCPGFAAHHHDESGSRSRIRSLVARDRDPPGVGLARSKGAGRRQDRPAGLPRPRSDGWPAT